MPRETREGWPLLTVEIEVNGDSKSTITIIGVLPWLVRWPCRVRTRDFCSALAALVGTVQNIFPPSYSISIPLSPLFSNLGRQPCWFAFLLVCVPVYMPMSLSSACLSLGEPFRESSFHLLKCVEDPFCIVNLPLCESEDKGQLFHRWDGLLIRLPKPKARGPVLIGISSSWRKTKFYSWYQSFLYTLDWRGNGTGSLFWPH
jgi:hypothetical protein